MNVEAFVGHLAAIPSKTTWGYNFLKIQGIWVVVYTSGGITTQNDPRVDSLPEGWRK